MTVSNAQLFKKAAEDAKRFSKKEVRATPHRFRHRAERYDPPITASPVSD